MSRELLVGAVAYRIQEDRYGGPSASVRMKLLARPDIDRGKSPRARLDRSIKPGTRFLREWNGRTHEVTATADSRYAYGGVTYRPLIRMMPSADRPISARILFTSSMRSLRRPRLGSSGWPTSVALK